MHEKKERIIEISMKLFADKGFHATSIQEIVQKADVSKGAFYLYFESKDDLLIAIFDYYATIVFEKLAKVRETTTDPYAQLEKQVAELLTLFRDHKEYLLVHFRDNIHIGDKLDALIYQIHKQGFDWVSEQVCAIYGDKVNHYIVDIAINFDGLMNSYFKWIALHNFTFNPELVAKTIIRRLDALVEDILTDENSPLFTAEDVPRLTDNRKTDEISQLSEQLSAKMDEIPLNNKEKQQLIDAITVIKEEAAKEAPKTIILKTMVEHIRQYEQLSQLSEQLSKKIL
ncbi:TetR/AcrR family transcriptional regulator [Gracilibacillus xinjiangensis]|uniref:TetR/AcrR family transcriptional regulator n=1 Tax=Gracilibacillus xinjiangensis TaxID=1193282 RepID=A0ABV8WSS0_9BACI